MSKLIVTLVAFLLSFNLSCTEKLEQVEFQKKRETQLRVITEYIVVQEVYERTFRIPNTEIADGWGKLKGNDIIALMAGFEESMRKANMLSKQAIDSLEMLKPLIKTEEMSAYIDEILSSISNYQNAINKFVKIFDESDGKYYKVLDRTDELWQSYSALSLVMNPDLESTKIKIALLARELIFIDSTDSNP